jgi:hypothetical protein
MSVQYLYVGTELYIPHIQHCPTHSHSVATCDMKLIINTAQPIHISAHNTSERLPCLRAACM